MAERKITKKELTEEMKAALEDVFCAQVSLKDGTIALKFDGGQTFLVDVREEERLG